MTALRDLSALSHRHRPLLVGLLIANVVLSALPAGYVAASRALVESLQNGHRNWWAIAVLGLVAGGERTIRAIENNTQRLLAERVSCGTGTDLLRQVSRSPYARFDDGQWCDELATATDTASYRIGGFVRALFQVLRSLLSNIAIVTALAAVDYRLALAATAAALLVLPGILFENKVLYALFYQHSRKHRERHYLADVLSSSTYAKDVRSLNLQPVLVARYGQQVDRWVADVKTVLGRSNRVALASALSSAAALAVGYAVLPVGGEGASTGSVVAALTGFLLLAGQLDAVVSAYAEVSAQAPYVDRLWRFLDAERTPASGPDLPPVAGPTSPGSTVAPVELNAVGFTYLDGTAALDDITLSVAAGEWVAIVGPNGAGKSSLLKVLAGLYTPTCGDIRVLGRRPEAGAEGVAALWQDFQIFSYSIEENIIFGRADPDAAADAGPTGVDVVGDLRRNIRDELAEVGLAFLGTDEGLRTRLGTFADAGHDLSGGQRQRLGIARTAYRGGRLWLLDEPTASLDAGDAVSTVQRLRERAAPSSGVVVTHHMGIARAMDRIIVLESGRIVDDGPHEQLILTDGLYRRLYDAQASAFLPTSRDHERAPRSARRPPARP